MKKQQAYAQLEEAAEELAWEKADIKFGKVDPNGCGIAHYWFREGFKDGYISGQELQKEQDNNISRQAEAERIKTQQMCYEKGQADMKRLMMEDAVEGVVISNSSKWVFAGNSEMNRLLADYKDGDKVRVIVLPKED